MQKWEYMCIKASHSRTKDTKMGGEKASHIPQIDAIMNALGDEGWELVGVQDLGIASSYHGAVLFFKRPKP